jgi:hypothetical protein
MPPEEIQGYLRNMRRVLAPTGHALVSVFFSDGPAFRDESIGFFLPKAQFLELLNAAELEGEHLFEPATGLTHNWFRLTPRAA